MKQWKIEFSAGEFAEKLHYYPNFYAKYDNHELLIYVQYDTHQEALCLRAECSKKDHVLFINRDYRIELYVNGQLMDEEWPYGNDGITESMLLELQAQPLTKEDWLEKMPSEVINPMYWNPEPNVFVGDCMPFVDGNTFHVFYLKDRRHHQSKWGLGAHQWAHIKSDNLKDWYACPMAVEIDDKMEGSICTGSVIKQNDLYYAYYSVRMSDGSPARITCSTSTDGEKFTKTHEYFEIPKPYDSVIARDPKAFLDQDNQVNLLITTAIGENEERRGCLARTKWTKDQKWEIVDPIYISDDKDEPECSDYFAFNGYYYLVFSHYGVGHYCYSKNPEGPWIFPDNNIVMDDTFRVPKAAVWKERLFFVAWDTENGFAGYMKFCEATASEDGKLNFNEI